VGEVWIPEAEDLTPVGTHNAMSGVGGPRATLHCTVSNPGSFDAMVRVLRLKSSESHLLYDPKTDRLGQFFPLNRAARALARGTLAYSHNRVGSINIQIEVCAMPVDWTAGPDWNPGPNFRAMLRAIRSWGIADEFIYRPAKTAPDRANVVRPDNLLTSTAGGGKWWGHCHYGQGESHWDPGPINLATFFGAAPITPTAPPEEDDMFTDEDRALLRAAMRQQDGAQLRKDIGYARDQMLAATDPAKLAATLGPALAAALPQTPDGAATVSDAQLEAALRKVLGSVDGAPA